MQTSNRTVSFNSERGRDIYVENQRVIIHISPDSCPLLNTQDSYLNFSLFLGNDKTGEGNGNYLIPDPKIGGACPFSTITIRSGDGSTVLEEMESCEIWHALKNKYGSNINDEQIRKIFGGMCELVNEEYIDNGTTAGAQRNASTTNGPAVTANPSRGGGFGSQFYMMHESNNFDNARKAEMLYRFPMSGILSSMKTELTPIIVLQGLIIELTLLEGAKFLRLQEVAQNDAGQITSTQIGYGIRSRAAAANIAPVSGGVQAFAGDGAQGYGPDQQCYAVRGYYDNAGAAQLGGDVAAATAITGIILANSADATATPATYNKYSLNNIENCSIKVGSKLRVGYTAATILSTQMTAALIDSVVTSLHMEGGRVHIRFDAFTTQAAVANITTGVLARGNPVACSLTTAGSPTYADAANLANLPANVTLNPIRYEVSDVEMVCNVVEAETGYLETLVKQAKGGQLKIQYNSYRDIRVNIGVNSLSNEMFIPTDLQRCYSLIGVNEILRPHSVLVDSVSPSVDNLRDYIFIFDGIRTPNQAVSLERMAAGRVNALAMIETEKAIQESSIPLKDIRNPSEFITIARRLGAYGSSVNLNGKTVKCRVNYRTQQPLSLLWHWFLYHTKSISFEGGSMVVLE